MLEDVLPKLLLILTKYNKPLHCNTEADTGEVLNKILHFIIAYDFQGYMDGMPAKFTSFSRVG